jgi:hypothetical protein
MRQFVRKAIARKNQNKKLEQENNYTYMTPFVG